MYSIYLMTDPAVYPSPPLPSSSAKSSRQVLESSNKHGTETCEAQLTAVWPGHNHCGVLPGNQLKSKTSTRQLHRPSTNYGLDTDASSPTLYDYLPIYSSTQCRCSGRVQNVKHLLLGCPQPKFTRLRPPGPKVSLALTPRMGDESPHFYICTSAGSLS